MKSVGGLKTVVPQFGLVTEQPAQVGVGLAVAVAVAVGVGVGVPSPLQKISIELSGVMPSDAYPPTSQIW